MRKNLLFIILFLATLPLFSQQLAKGFVFEDINRNGSKERREPGIAGVAVSNGFDVVLTRDDEPEVFTAIIFGDPQPYSMEDLDYFTRKIVEDVHKNEKNPVRHQPG